MLSPRIYIRNFAGLGNRIESLALALALSERGGHTLVLDWPELDLLRVAGSLRGHLPWWRRPVRFKPRRLDDNRAVDRAARHGTIEVRRFYGDAPAFDESYLTLTRRLSIAPSAAQEITRCFTQHAAGRPVVGMHVRRGDFNASASLVYAPHAHRHTAVPMWWYLDMMALIKATHPQVKFFAALHGQMKDFPELAARDDLFTLSIAPDACELPDEHKAGVHPVADLFALACCSVVLATPGSSFSHVAVNLLGPRAEALVPVAGSQAGAPLFGCLDQYHRRLEPWINASKNASAGAPLPIPAPAHTDWLFDLPERNQCA